MKKRIIFALLCLNFATTISAQLQSKGWWTRDLFSFDFLHQDASLADNRFGRNYHRYFTQPELGYVLNKHWMAGIVTQFESISDRYDIPADKSGLALHSKRFYGAGPLLRHYLTLSKRAYFMSEIFTFWSHERIEDTQSSQGVESKSSYSQNVFGAGAFPSIVYFLTRDMAFSITVVKIGYYAGRNSRSFGVDINPQQWLFGVEFYFEKKKAKPVN